MIGSASILFLVGVLSLLGKAQSRTITVYRSPLTYYDKEFDVESSRWIELSDAATNVSFSSRFDCLFVTLPFQLPFYADVIDKICLTKLGFVYTGPYSNVRLTELMHIAPLMNLYQEEGGEVFYETKTDESGVQVFIVEWCDMILLNSSASFQLHIYSNGTLVLAYEKVAEMIRNTGITSVTSSFPWITADTKASGDIVYFQYEQIKIASEDIGNDTSIILNLRTNCQSASNCTECLDIGASTDFSCQWCDSVRRCSDTFDKQYYSWGQECTKPTTSVGECAVNDDSIAVSSLYEDALAEEMAAVVTWLESIANMTSDECEAGTFYSPFTGTCNDCIYCASADCHDQCLSATAENRGSWNDPRRNMKMKDYTFKNFNSGAGFWKSAFIGMTCAVVVCICFALVAMCMKRRNYVQPGGASWSVSHSAPTSVNRNLDEKPLIYGTSTAENPYNA